MENIVEYSLKKNESNYVSIKITTSKDAYDYISRFYGDDIDVFESFFLLLLNAGNNTIGYVKISQGGIVGTIVDNRIVAKYCIDSLATAVILAHNHPSGNLKPSEQDLRLTKKLSEALSLFDIKIMDHVILTRDGYYSFTDNGTL